MFSESKTSANFYKLLRILRECFKKNSFNTWFPNPGKFMGEI